MEPVLMKIVYFGDSPRITTGLAQVTRTIANALCYDHELEIIAMNHWNDEHSDSIEPFKIHPCVSKDYRNVESAKEIVLKADYDMLIYSADVGFSDIFNWAQEAREKHDFLFVAYVPVDCDIIHESAFDCLEVANVIATYTEHGKRIISQYKPHLADRVNVIPLACEPHLYYPLGYGKRTTLRKELFGIDDSTFLVGCVERNQHRKDLGRTMLYFHEYHKTHPNSILYMHTAQNDIGGSLPAMAQSIGMEIIGENREVIFTGDDYSTTIGYPPEWLNKLYNCFDVLVSTSTGEGHGLTKTEAMAAGCPVCVPNNTANIEHVGEHEERGFLIETGGDLDHLQFLYGLVNYPRDIVHSNSFLSTLDYIYLHPDVARYRADKAIKWTRERTEDKIALYWQRLAAIQESYLEEVPS